MVRESTDQLAARWPKTKAALSTFRRRYGPLFQQALATRLPAPDELAVVEHGRTRTRTAELLKLTIGRKDQAHRIPALLMTPREAAAPERAVLLVHPEGAARIAADRGRRLHPVAAGLLKAGCSVLSIDCFGAGAAARYTDETPPHFATYNRTDVANRVQDILTALAYLSSPSDAGRAALVGLGEAGVWCLLARGLAPEVAACAADVAKLDLNDDEAVAGRLFVPLLRKAGDLRTAAALAAPGPLFLHNAGDRFPTTWLARLYSAAGSRPALQLSRAKASAGDISQFVIQQLAAPRRRRRARRGT
jgi:hypothetical protein